MTSAQSSTAQGGPQEVLMARTSTKPVIIPDTFDGDIGWDEWIGHFNSVARVNDWNDQTKLLWLEVRLVGKARKAWNRLTTEDRNDYNSAVIALRQRFEPESRRDLYAAEFQTRGRKPNESWGETADNLRSLADKAFPDLDEVAKEKLSVDRYLTLLEKPDVSLAVRQRRPKTLNDAVSATLETEAFMSLGNQRGYQIRPELTPTTSVAGVDSTVNATLASKDDKMYEMLQTLVSRMNQMELTIARMDSRCSNLTNTPRPARGQEKDRSDSTRRGPIICNKCGKPGHYARGCASRRSKAESGNY